MARLARLVVPGLPHHVTQRGNGRARTFFGDNDYQLYRDLLGEACLAAKVDIWAWVLMPNHVHLILAPSDADGLRKALSSVHRYYAGYIHKRTEQCGHFWQGRFGAVAMDEPHLAAALRYVALNPVRAKLADHPLGWRWSSAHAHTAKVSDGITNINPVLERYPNFGQFLETAAPPDAIERLRQAETIGRPLGDTAFLTRIEPLTQRTLKPGKPGPKKKSGL